MPRNYTNVTLKSDEARQRILDECDERVQEPTVCTGCRWYLEDIVDCKQRDVVDGILKIGGKEPDWVIGVKRHLHKVFAKE